MAKAVVLISGGLDSSLAAIIVKREGVKVDGVTFSTPFFSPDASLRVARELGIPLKIIDISIEFIDLLYNPRHGFGRNMNPCIDCHTMMIRHAGGYMASIGADFIVTGEVLGSRPKSQSRSALEIVAKESGFDGLILRPLSAKLLPPSIPEISGLIERENLLDIHGRTRRRQLNLAKEFGIKRFSTPAGGCLLCDPNFSNRLRDELEHKIPNVNDLKLLRVGRHFRISRLAKVVIGRNERENILLLELARSGDLILETKGVKGAIALLRGEVDEDVIIRTASLCGRYSDGRALLQLEVVFRVVGKDKEGSVIIHPREAEEIGAIRL